MEVKFYICKHCGNIVMKVKDVGVPVMCCGQRMEEIVPGITEAAVEKHIPVLEQKDNLVHVEVGSVAHPMTEPHFIEWIVLKTTHGFQFRQLAYTDEPKADFALAEGEKVEEALAYCNLHSLWKA